MPDGMARPIDGLPANWRWDSIEDTIALLKSRLSRKR